jgi:hypothetical protein
MSIIRGSIHSPILWAVLLLCVGATRQHAQTPAGGSVIPGTKVGGSSNLHVLAHVPLGAAFTSTNLEIEQELNRPYVYASRMFVHGMDVIDVRNPRRPTIIYSWRIQAPELHLGIGGMDNKYFKHQGRYYDVLAVQFEQGGPDADLGAVVFDVTGLPDTSKIREVGRIRAPDVTGGFHNVFAYKHSDGRALLFASNGPHANVYDMGKFLAGDARSGLVGLVPVPDTTNQSPNACHSILCSYHDFFVGYDPAGRRDVFYGAGSGGYFVYDVTSPEEPRLLTSIVGSAGIRFGHTFTPDPTGRYVIAETEYQYAPLRVFDLKPGLDGTLKTISRPIGAWTADWRALPHNTEVRWPYVFVSTYEDGLQVINLMDPTNPYTVGHYYTCECPHLKGYATTPNPIGGSIYDGAFGIDVRNADGLIVIEDFRTGFWTFRMDGFDGWNGRQWGMPNISSAQDWDNGPEGAPRSKPAS